MKKISEWINNHKAFTAFIAIIIVILPMLIVQILFKLTAPIKTLEAAWEAPDLLGYFGDVLTFLGTIILGYVAIVQGEKANKLNDDLLELEWKRQQPCLDVVNNQTYRIYIDEEIDKYIANIDIFKELRLDVLYEKAQHTGMVVQVALIEIILVNSGNSDIRRIYLKDFKFNLTDKDPCIATCPYSFIGDQYIKKSETRKLIINVEQEISESEITTFEQFDWLKQTNRIFLPHMDFTLHIVTVEGIDYIETLSISSGWHRSLQDKNFIKERNIIVRDIDIQRMKR